MGKFKHLLIGIIIGGIVFSRISIFAADGTKPINVKYNNIKITLDGIEIKTDVEPFQYEGHTFVSVEPIVEALDASVSWNQKTKTVEIKKNKSDIVKNAAELKILLEKKYSKLKTCIGETKFNFAIVENQKTYNPYDYRIMVYYDDYFFYEAKINIKYTNEQKETLGKQLRQHQYDIAHTAINSMSTKKFYGGYYKGYWQYPALQMDWQESNYCSWINFSLSNLNSVIFTDYEQAKITDFKWHSEHDMYLPGETKLP